MTIVALNTKNAESSPVTKSTTLTTVPQRPTIDAATDLPESADVQVTWTPGATGGSPVVSYRYLVDGTAGTHEAGTTTDRTLVVTGIDGEELTVTVWTSNAEGESAASAPATVVVVDDTPAPPGGPPGGGGGG